MVTKSSSALSPGEPPHRSHRRRPVQLHPHHLVDATALPLYRFLTTRVHPFWLHLCYFASLSLLGFLLLWALPPRAPAPAPPQAPSNFDLFFMSVSAATVSSMGVVEMEFFSNLQLIVLAVLMLMGGEVFTSMLSLYLRKLDVEITSVEFVVFSDADVHGGSDSHIELGRLVPASEPAGCSDAADGHRKLQLPPPLTAASTADREQYNMRASAARFLGFVVLGYLLAVNLVGSSLVLAYLAAVPAARDVVRSKRIPLLTFAVFSVVSSFGNCGFIPTNENMVVFRDHSGLLLLLAAVVLAGNTLYPPLLRAAIWAAGRCRARHAAEYEFVVRNCAEMEYEHLLSARRCRYLAATVAAFVLLQAAAFCCTEWRSAGLEGMGRYQKVAAALFMAVNARHAGESVVDLARVSPALLVLYVVMMYLPPYTCFMPVEHDHDGANSRAQTERYKKKVPMVVENLIFSQLSYVAIFTILICITERTKLSQDPLNFSVLNIIVEVVRPSHPARSRSAHLLYPCSPFPSRCRRPPLLRLPTPELRPLLSSAGRQGSSASSLSPLSDAGRASAARGAGAGARGASQVNVPFPPLPSSFCVEPRFEFASLLADSGTLELERYKTGVDGTAIDQSLQVLVVSARKGQEMLFPRNGVVGLDGRISSHLYIVLI